MDSQKGKHMQGYNCVMVYNKGMDRLLMCRRKKEPYKGKSNLVGGKIEPGEDGIYAAYRELEEETGITQNDIALKHLMDFVYCLHNCYVEIYVGKLKTDVSVFGDENELYWSGLDRDFFDLELFAGEGNIGHMVELVKRYGDEIFGYDSKDKF